MAFADLLDLRTAVLEEVGRSDLAEVFPRLVLLAEAKLNQKLRTRHQITQASLTFTNSRASLPSDYIAPVALVNAEGAEYPQAALARVLERPHLSQYAIDGGEVVGPSGDLTLHYYAKLPTLTASLTTSNWLLENYPSVYLYAVEVEAAKHIRDVEAVPAVMELLRMEMDGLERDDSSARFGRARVRVGGPTP